MGVSRIGRGSRDAPSPTKRIGTCSAFVKRMMIPSQPPSLTRARRPVRSLMNDESKAVSETPRRIESHTTAPRFKSFKSLNDTTRHLHLAASFTYLLVILATPLRYTAAIFTTGGANGSAATTSSTRRSEAAFTAAAMAALLPGFG